MLRLPIDTDVYLLKESTIECFLKNLFRDILSTLINSMKTNRIIHTVFFFESNKIIFEERKNSFLFLFSFFLFQYCNNLLQVYFPMLFDLSLFIIIYLFVLFFFIKSLSLSICDIKCRRKKILIF